MLIYVHNLQIYNILLLWTNDHMKLILNFFLTFIFWAQLKLNDVFKLIFKEKKNRDEIKIMRLFEWFTNYVTDCKTLHRKGFKLII